jgi:hypothetical protein
MIPSAVSPVPARAPEGWAAEAPFPSAALPGTAGVFAYRAPAG